MSCHLFRFTFFPSSRPPQVSFLLSNLYLRGGGEDFRKISWVDWDSVCCLREEGGLGVRRLREFNVSLLGKWCWQMLVNKEGLWYRVLQARYGEEGGRLKEGGRDGSLWWRMISSIRRGVGQWEGSWFEDNVRRIVGGGGSTFFWSDNWVGDVPLRVKFPRLFDLAVDKWVTVQQMTSRGWAEGGGAWEWRRRLLAWEEELVSECASLLHSVVLQDYTIDRWRWMLDPLHGYSVKGTYTYLTTTGAPSQEWGRFDDVWVKEAPLKVSIFV